MQVNYNIIHAKDFIKAKPSGQTDLEQSKKALGQLADMVRCGGDYEILMDVRDSYGNLTHDEVWELVLELGRHRSAFRNKIAILSREEEQFNRAVFAELCANSMGFTVAAFTDFEKAMNWILSSDGLEGLWE